ncbi:50S ribosomal protein L3 glutamine methyltransferase [Pseudohongiella nitratireducens]|uniref:50S ribosomal protein L3 glutamine methyltransferase n=1 Tax=Pseudohongiella nitratireducens TaxID=1768907 RepID=A0A917GT15_9GAMM|nr:50S ribosomal protein L3 N(5)-glutamine methyltransferase [Pseudohongiella nitratireducens]MDF1624457.1 50S ribosomal protein L3 N(5)-glutamine methyltransferase [Pseudohongiella nitratireducens]GGG56558.1 50S ribosomal protein L3 glutamine methyltransferase [Pseudohongiella nitratireducens]|tara:strand:+ start:1931 stop:2821 length:891 start_codon:yes stop_codon:yes gene_type:complete
MKVGEYIQEAADQFENADLFYGHGTDNAADEALYLVFSYLRLDYTGDDSQFARPLSENELVALRDLAQRRITERVPVAYLVNEAWFAGLPFHSDSRALVPRSPLAELILNHYEPLLDELPQRVLDLCTGSGCIGIATAAVFPQAEVDLADISVDALALAEQNIARHQLQSRVRTVASDLFDGLHEAKATYDLIVSNPPYVSAEEVMGLPAEYGHEPSLGLLSDEDGLLIPLRILRQAPDYLTESGVLVMEVGYSWQALMARYPDLPVVWLEFEQGGEGVMAIGRDALIRVQSMIRV